MSQTTRTQIATLKAEMERLEALAIQQEDEERRERVKDLIPEFKVFVDTTDDKTKFFGRLESWRNLYLKRFDLKKYSLMDLRHLQPNFSWSEGSHLSLKDVIGDYDGLDCIIPKTKYDKVDGVSKIAFLLGLLAESAKTADEKAYWEHHQTDIFN